jgi:hypothetical protein
MPKNKVFGQAGGRVNVIVIVIITQEERCYEEKSY